jgi:surface antigen
MNEKQITLSEDLLVAYVDRELAAQDMELVEAALAHDEAARETVRLLRFSAEMAQRAFAEVPAEPLPERLLRAARGSKQLPQLARRLARGQAWRGQAWRRLAPIAAGIATLAVGLAGGYGLHSLTRSTDGGGGYEPAAASVVDGLTASYEATLQGALETGQPGQSFTYDSDGLGQGTIRLGTGFTTAYGADCRQFTREEKRGAALSAADGIACRGASGGWSVMLLPKGS